LLAGVFCSEIDEGVSRWRSGCNFKLDLNELIDELAWLRNSLNSPINSTKRVKEVKIK
jgi:hypothetical protein